MTKDGKGEMGDVRAELSWWEKYLLIRAQNRKIVICEASQNLQSIFQLPQIVDSWQ